MNLESLRMAPAPAPQLAAAAEIRDVVREHRLPGGLVRALNGVSLAVEQGRSLAIVGASGSGKSTLLRMLGGLDLPTHGTVSLLGEPTAAWSSDRWALARARDVGFVFQAANLFETFTALENVSAPLELGGMGARLARREALDLLDRVGLADRAARLPRELSGGEAQRVAIARAMTGDRHLVLADEPTAALDSANGSAVVSLILQSAPTVVIVTHDESVAARADRIVRLRDGRIVDPGAPTR